MMALVRIKDKGRVYRAEPLTDQPSLVLPRLPIHVTKGVVLIVAVERVVVIRMEIDGEA